MIPQSEIFLRIGLALVLGAVIGFEREFDNQPAGLRTNIILVMGACLAMILSIQISQQFAAEGKYGDPARLAAQVVTGIGFLGAGAILHSGFNIKGLTTAATIWSMAIVGLAVGAGFYYEAVIVTLILVMVLSLVERWELKTFKAVRTISASLVMAYAPTCLDEVRNVFSKADVRLDKFSYENDLEKQEITINLEYRSRKPKLLETVREELGELNGLKRIKVGSAFFS
jgi:putative Mg2+ transporter-C (MgtC) family protein